MLGFSGIQPRSSGKTSDDQLFHAVDASLEEVRRMHGSISWVFIGFPASTTAGQDTTLVVLSQGAGHISDQENWPQAIFDPKSLCYGLFRLEVDATSPTSPRTPRCGSLTHATSSGTFSFSVTSFVISLCWKGATMPFSLRTKHTEFHKRIQDHLGGVIHLQVKTPDDLTEENIKLNLPSTKRRSLRGVNVKTSVEIAPEVQQAYADIRKDSVPFNWMVAGYDQTTDAEQPTKLILLETGMGGYNALSGLGGINSSISSPGVKYIYMRIDVPLQQGPVSKYILVTYHHVEPIHEDEGMFSPPSSESKVATATNTYSFGAEIYRFFPHHIHFFASSMADLSEEVVRERVRRSIDSDRLFLRLVCILPTGEAQPAICIETPREATLEELKSTIEQVVGLPPQRQRLVWFHAKNYGEATDFHEFQSTSQATLLTHNTARLQQDIGLTYGDKIHMDDMSTGPDSILARLVEQMNAGSEVMSLPAERRHEVEYNVQAREKELKKHISMTADMIEMAKAAPSDGSKTKELQVQAERLDSQQRYLDIPYDSIRLLDGKENELGCGKCATVYRGMWIVDSNKVAEVAVKVFRYARLTDKIMSDYTQEVAMLRQLKHPNIVLFIGACIQPKLMILTEYCARRSLHYVIHNHTMFATIPWKFKVRMMLDAARGVEYLHSVRIIHRDIKSHNLLVDDDWRVKVADFGISKVLDADSQAFTQCGTSGWVAPEVLLDEDVGYTFKADNWSFAIVMWEVIAGVHENPFLGMAPVKFYNKALTGVRPLIDDEVDPNYASLIRECWQNEPTQRPNFSTIVARLESILEELGMDTGPPPTFNGGYHSLS
ncbi:hypothetical protein AC1031_012658 [Aphanomyces cochlioides]|nr:hypothetical protein AC1031_012658 [Aphanomyces cochlioides]